VSLGGCVARSQLSQLGDGQGRLILEDPLTGAHFAFAQFVFACCVVVCLSAVHISTTCGRLIRCPTHSCRHCAYAYLVAVLACSPAEHRSTVLHSVQHLHQRLQSV
jgi:hypothetical protein